MVLTELRRLASLARVEESELRESVQLLSLILDLSPFPQWIKVADKDEDGNFSFRMLRINRAYVERWGIQKADYEGKLDTEVWGKDIGAQFARNDLRAVEMAPEVYYTHEAVPDCVGEGLTETVPMWRIAKSSNTIAGRIYVAGIAMRCQDPDCAQHTNDG